MRAWPWVVGLGLALVEAALLWSQPDPEPQGPPRWTSYDLGPSHDAVFHPFQGPAVSFRVLLPGGVVGGVSVVGHRIYGSGLDGSVFALASGNGKLLWVHKLPNAVFDPPTVLGDRLFVGIGNDVFQRIGGRYWIRGTPPSGIYALKASNGQLLWSHPTRGNDKTSPLFDPQTGWLYEPDGDHWLRALRPDGRLVWKVNDEGLDDFSFPTEVGGRLYVNTGSALHPALRAFSARTGKLLWSYASTNADNTPTYGAGRFLVVNTLPFQPQPKGPKLLAEVFQGVDLNGHLRWRYMTRPGPYPPAFQAPAATYRGGVFYITSSVRPYLYAFQARSGRLLYKTRLPGVAYDNPTVAGPWIFEATLQGELLVLRRKDGKILKEVPLGGQVGAGGMTLIDNTLYVGLIEGTPATIVSGGAPKGALVALALPKLLAGLPVQ